MQNYINLKIKLIYEQIIKMATMHHYIYLHTLPQKYSSECFRKVLTHKMFFLFLNLSLLVIIWLRRMVRRTWNFITVSILHGVEQSFHAEAL